MVIYGETDTQKASPINADSQSSDFLRSRIFYLLLLLGLPGAILTHYLTMGSPQPSIQGLFFAIVVFPVLEELSFRGVLQGYVSRWWPGKLSGLSLANWLVSGIFAGLHALYFHELWLLLVFVPSLVFGFCKDHYQSLIPSCLMHSAYNFCYLSSGWFWP